MMKNKITALALALLPLLPGPAQAQIYDTNNVVVQTFAGFGLPTYLDGQGQFSAFSSPSQVVADTAGNLFVWDGGNARIRKITPDGTVSTFAGGGAYFEGFGTNVSLAWGTVSALAIDHANKLWLVLVNGYNGGTYLLSVGTDAHVAIENGGLTNLTSTSGICFDSANNLYYSGGNRIYRYNPATGTAQPFAGNGVAGNFDGQGPVFSAFANPGALACDQADNLYVWDSGNATIRRIDPAQTVTTLAGNNYYSYSILDGTGTNATFYSSGITSMCTDQAGNLYLVSGSSVRKMNAQTSVVTVAGNFSYWYGGSYADGPGNLARFNNAVGGCFARGMIFVADSGNHRIRSIAFDPQPQVVAPADLQLKTYPGLQITGTVGRTYQIQSSANLTDWTTVTTVLLNASPYLWVDTNSVSGSKYYRAARLP